MSDEVIKKLGTDALKNVTGGAFHLVQRITVITSETSAGGKKITVPEMIGSAGAVYDLGKAVINAKQAIAEIGDMDQEEEDDFLAWAIVEFDLPNEKAKKLILKCISALLEIAGAIELFIELKTA